MVAQLVPYALKRWVSSSGAVERHGKDAVVELRNKDSVVEAPGMSTCRAGRSMNDCTVGSGDQGGDSKNPFLS